MKPPTARRLLVRLALSALGAVIALSYGGALTARAAEVDADEQQQAKRSFDEQSLEKLGDDDQKAESQKPKADDVLDRELLEGLDAGEDLGQEGDPLLKLSRDMRTAEDLIAKLRTGADTQTLQKRIVEELTKLIQEQCKKCQGGQSLASSAQASRRGSAKQPGRSQGNTGGRSNQPAADSTDRLDPSKPELPQTETPQDLWKRVWGHLPERIRDQMSQHANEQFLPKYEVEIEEYFRNLAEMEENRAAPRR